MSASDGAIVQRNTICVGEFFFHSHGSLDSNPSGSTDCLCCVEAREKCVRTAMTEETSTGDSTEEMEETDEEKELNETGQNGRNG